MVKELVGFLKSKRVQGIVIFVASGILGAKGIIDPETASLGKTLGGGWAGIGFYHAQEKSKPKP